MHVLSFSAYKRFASLNLIAWTAELSKISVM